LFLNPVKPVRWRQYAYYGILNALTGTWDVEVNMTNTVQWYNTGGWQDPVSQWNRYSKSTPNVFLRWRGIFIEKQKF
jgi:intein-encoded DNA endonuclease-like protein